MDLKNENALWFSLISRFICIFEQADAFPMAWTWVLFVFLRTHCFSYFAKLMNFSPIFQYNFNHLERSHDIFLTCHLFSFQHFWHFLWDYQKILKTWMGKSAFKIGNKKDSTDWSKVQVGETIISYRSIKSKCWVKVQIFWE